MLHCLIFHVQTILYLIFSTVVFGMGQKLKFIRCSRYRTFCVSPWNDIVSYAVPRSLLRNTKKEKLLE